LQAHLKAALVDGLTQLRNNSQRKNCSRQTK